ncbi:TonB-system energizer ExbB [Sulfurospirillum cavolei]|uniref:TonB-system energizer ExbB n=1 Tax=Sulfurospirillum cavolei TaxID=366522 RepID=UPI0005A674DA|nr:TonB-system energizer ExbB [Sulfurospirillum cavolei]
MISIELMQHLVDYGVIGLLGVMSFLTLFFWIERLLFFRTLHVRNYACKEKLEMDVSNHIHILSTFGSNAPYIGLLGTVCGIIITFYAMGQSGQIDVKTIMSSLALALKATAMGLVVAIPAIFFYNHLIRKIEKILLAWDIEQKKETV